VSRLTGLLLRIGIGLNDYHFRALSFASIVFLSSRIHFWRVEMDFKPGEVVASIDEIAVYNMVFTQAMFEVLVTSGVLDGDAVREKITQIKQQTQVKLKRVQ
jgi:hypothetical protein